MQKSYKTVPLSHIKPYPNNPRINDAAAKDVAKSIEQCGYIAPIVVVDTLFGEFTPDTLPTRYLRTYCKVEKMWSNKAVKIGS